MKSKGEIGAGQHGRDFFHALNLFDAALRLLGLGGLGLEAVNKALQVGDFFLLALKRCLLQHQLLGVQLFKFAVVAAVARQPPLVNVQGDAGGGIQKFAVVADDDQGACIALEPGFQPDQRVQVQVVGGLVQQQQVRRAHQGPRQLQAHLPAARKTIDRLLQLLGLEAQPQNQGLGAGRGIVRPGILQVGVQLGNVHPVAGFFGFGQALLQGLQAGVASKHKSGGALVGIGQVLGDLGHAPLRRNKELSAIFVQAPGQQGKQRGLARAVAPDQADVLAGMDGGGDTVQHQFGAPAQGDVFQGNHGGTIMAGAQAFTALVHASLRNRLECRSLCHTTPC